MDIFRGDTFIGDIIITKDGVAYDLSGATLFFTVKASALSPDSAAVVRETSGEGGGISITDPPTGGRAALTVAASVMEKLIPNKTYQFDIQVVDLSGAVFTVETGTLSVLADITRRVSV